MNEHIFRANSTDMSYQYTDYEPNNQNGTQDGNVQYIPNDIAHIPLTWLLKSEFISSDYNRPITATLPNILNCHTIAELINLNKETIEKAQGIGNRKVQEINSLKESLLNIISDNDRLNKLRTCYTRSITTPTLPSPGHDGGESYASLIKRFIDEVAERYTECDKKDSADVIRLAYQHGYDINSISVNKHKTRTRIEQWLTERNPQYKSFLWILHNNLHASDKSNSELYIVADAFRNAMQAIQEFCNKTPLKKSLKQFLGSDTDDCVIKFIQDYLGAKIFGGETGYNTRIKEQFVIVDCDLGHLNDKWGVVFRLLGQCVKPIKKENLICELRKEFETLSEQVEHIITNIIENSNQFDVKRTDLTTTYSLKWPELMSMQSRIERILYESQQPMQRADIEEEYYRRVRIYGLEKPDVFPIRKSKNIHQLYSGGTWIWTAYTEQRRTISMEQRISQYAAKHQKFQINNLMEYLREQGLQTINEKSIRATLTKYCYTTTEGYYFDRDSKLDLSNFHIVTSEDILPKLVQIMSRDTEYTYRNLSQMYSAEYKISLTDSKITRTISNNPNVFITIKSCSRKVPNKVKINPAWDGKYKKVNDKRPKARAEWRSNVKEELINKLRYASNYEMKCSELCKHIESFIPKKISKTGVYKIFRNDNIFTIKRNEHGRNTIALNIQEWEKEYKQHLKNQDVSTRKYESTDQTLQNVQQQQLNSPSYNISTQTDEDLNNLYASTQSLISYNLKTLTSDNMGITDLKEAWSYMVEQMKIRSGSADNAYYRMLNQLYGYMFGSTTRTDRYYLWVEVRYNFEPYLKHLLTSNGFYIKKYNGLEMQLKDVINLCQKKNLLPTETEQCHITKCISNMLYTRNIKGHNAEDTPDDKIIVDNIQKAITLYLYISMQFKNLNA